MIGIINYGVGNLQSVYNAFVYLGQEVYFINSGDDFKKASALVIPGVGHFQKGMSGIINNGFLEPLNFYVLEKKIPCLGICLGMQLMADTGLEGGPCKGLGWFPSVVERIDSELPGFSLKIPHVGWNEVKINAGSPLFKGMSSPTFYFVHSYYVRFDEGRQDYMTSYVDYGRKVTASAEKENIFAVQFHPEKSQQDGLKLLKNFIKVVNHG